MLRGLAAFAIGGRRIWQRGIPFKSMLQGLGLTGAACALLASPPPADALPPSEAGVSTTATVPASNEAMLLFSRLEQGIQQADWRLVLALRERLMGMGNELVVAPPGRTYYPIWRQATKIFDRLPPDGRELYRQIYESEASARLREVAPSGDIAALQMLFRTYWGLNAWPAIAGELVAQLLDRGQFAEAVETIQLLSAAQPQLSPEHRAARGCAGVSGTLGCGADAA